ncbi:YheC/D like ATP-grasp [Paenibacillus sp. yr247]|uniref:YheC/YheD family protein n=1 Tax=Paenibacillus sp. yr247 TaxID=1761880 RepID=UPI0008916F56|nr:YheC/YheD family protein [Paenibacillus sp. yr247]SDP18822.1 YheC/D like ATP-grasp [Paenibacillus sp. yr247]
MVYWNNKLGKYRAMLTNEELARHLPPTKLATKVNIHGMLEKYHTLYLKPNHGTGGMGIFKLSQHGNYYRLQNGTHSRTFTTFDGAYAAFAKAKVKKIYLVQKGIPLLHYQKRPFDLRIMVQRSPQRKWEVTGIVGRLARPHKVVTNYHSGGMPMQVDELLAPFVPRAKQAPYINLLNTLGLRISRHMSSIFPRFLAYGVDIGIDKELKPWIIEVNTMPDKYIFNALADKRMFRKIMRYAELTKNKRMMEKR